MPNDTVPAAGIGLPKSNTATERRGAPASFAPPHRGIAGEASRPSSLQVGAATTVVSHFECVCSTDYDAAQATTIARALWLLLSGDIPLTDERDRAAVTGLARELVDYTEAVEASIAAERTAAREKIPAVGGATASNGAT